MGHHDDDEDDEDFDDPEMPDESDVPADGDSVDTAPCPHCRRPVYEQAEICPHCGSYISTEDTTSRKPLWIVLVGIATLAAIVIHWVWRRG